MKIHFAEYLKKSVTLVPYKIIYYYVFFIAFSVSKASVWIYVGKRETF